jgi:hypothetical protein
MMNITPNGGSSAKEMQENIYCGPAGGGRLHVIEIDESQNLEAQAKKMSWSNPYQLPHSHHKIYKLPINTRYRSVLIEAIEQSIHSNQRRQRKLRYNKRDRYAVGVLVQRGIHILMQK